MAGGCVVDADCAPAGDDTWCVRGYACDAQQKACIVWPRCRNSPWLGCLNATQQCVDTRLEAGNASPALLTRAGPSNETIGVLFALYAGCALLIVIAALCSWYFYHRADTRQPQQQQQQQQQQLYATRATKADLVDDDDDSD